MDIKKLKQLIKKPMVQNAPPKSTFGTDPNDPWSTKANIAESASLDRYLLSRGIQPKFVSRDVKVAHAKSNQFKQWLQNHQNEEVQLEDMGTMAVKSATRSAVRSSAKSAIDGTKGRADALEKSQQAYKQIKTPHGPGNIGPGSGVGSLTKKSGPPKVDRDPVSQTPRMTQEDTIDEVSLGNYVDQAKKQKKELKKHIEGEYGGIAQRMLARRNKGLSMAKKRNEEVQLTESEDSWGKEGYGLLKKSHEHYKDSQAAKARGDHAEHDRLIKLTKDTHKAATEKRKEYETSTDPEHVTARKRAADKMWTSIDTGHGKGRYMGDSVEVYDKPLEEANITHAVHFDDPKTGKWASMALLTAKNDQDAVSQAHDLLRTDAYRHYKLSAVERHEPVNNIKMKEDVELDEEKLSAAEKLHRAIQKQREKSAPDRARFQKRLDAIMPSPKKDVKENVSDDPKGATHADGLPPDNNTQITPARVVAERKKELSKSARMIKSLYKNHKVVKEDLYDHEKADKSVATYGKKPKMDSSDPKDSTGENKPQAAAVLSGGTTLTGEKRDTIEIDPMMRARPGQPDPTKKKDGEKDAKKDDKKKDK